LISTPGLYKQGQIRLNAPIIKEWRFNALTRSKPDAVEILRQVRYPQYVIHEYIHPLCVVINP